MPLPDKDRLTEYLWKGAEAARREMHRAPEHQQAKQLAASIANAAMGNDGEFESEAAGRRVLMLSPRDWAYQTAVDGMVASALRVRGADVAFVSCGGGLEVCDRANVTEAPPMPCRTCTKYVDDNADAFGFERFPIRDGWDGVDDGTWPELDAMSSSELIDVTYEGLPLGRLMQIPSKWFLLASRSDWDPLSPQMTRKFLISARRIVQGLKKAIADFEPDTMVMLSGLFSFESVALAVCQQAGIEVLTYERTYRRDNLIFRRNAPASHYEITEEWNRYKDQPLTPIEEAELDEYLQSRQQSSHPIFDFWKDAKAPEVDTERKGRSIVLFTNVTWDSAVIGRERAYDSIHDWVSAAIETMKHLPEDRLTVRVHPAETKMSGKRTREPFTDFIAARFPTLPSNVEIIGPDEPVLSYPLMEAADIGLVLTSIVGLELAVMGKPVIVAGRPHYFDRGFTVDAGSPAEFVELLADCVNDPARMAPDVELARRYAYTFFFRAAIPFAAVAEPVPGLARLTTTEAADLAPGANPDLDRLIDVILGTESASTMASPTLERT